KTARLSFADLLESLDERDWSADSLCAGWTVRDVAAHMTLSTRTTFGMVFKGALRARGDFDRMEFRLAKDRAAVHTPAELIAQMRETAGSAHRTLGSAPLDPLVDALAHAQDIARPLGRVHEMPADAAVPAIEQVVTRKFYGAHKRLGGVRLVATDCDWTHGDGVELRGPIADLMLTATGRRAGLAALEGPALETVAARM
ncbi:MAG TPA: maleylpyruvate isomerase family mycothiol-dependent enzyme, partial [Phytomonospora sp.]